MSLLVITKILEQKPYHSKNEDREFACIFTNFPCYQRVTLVDCVMPAVLRDNLSYCVQKYKFQFTKRCYFSDGTKICDTDNIHVINPTFLHTILLSHDMRAISRTEAEFQ